MTLPVRTLIGLVVVLSAAALGVPAAADASTAGMNGSILVVEGGPEASNMEVTTSGVTDAAGITAGPGCAQESPTAVSCPGDDAVSAVQVALGDGDDEFRAFRFRAFTIDAGAGNDRVLGSIGPDTISGGTGNDNLDGSSDNDTVDGGPGDDTVSGGAHDDVVDGGPGRDSITGDTAAGSTSDGNDRIGARDGEADQISCGFGADVVTADQFDVPDNSQCEQVDVAQVGAPGADPGQGGQTGGGNGPPIISLTTPRRTTISSLLRRGMAIRFRLDEPAEVVVGLLLDARTARRLGLGRRPILLDGGTGSVEGGASVRLRPGKRFARKLARARQFTALVIVEATDADGEVGTVRRRVTVRR